MPYTCTRQSSVLIETIIYLGEERSGPGNNSKCFKKVSDYESVFQIQHSVTLGEKEFKDSLLEKKLWRR